MLKAIFAVVEPNVIQAYSEFPTAPAIEEFGGFEDWHYGGNSTWIKHILPSCSRIETCYILEYPLFSVTRSLLLLFIIWNLYHFTLLYLLLYNRD